MDQIALHPFLVLGFILVAGYFAGKLANLCRLPQISGYIMLGLGLSPSISGILTTATVEAIFGVISEMALAIIAYSIGGSLKISQVRDLGREILWAALMSASAAFACTFLAVVTVGSFLALPAVVDGKLFLSMALILGGVAVATAPASTLAVVHEQRAQGPLTTTLLGVVALDDALGIIVFAGVMALVVGLSGLVSPGQSLLLPGLMEIGGALVLGGAGGLAFSAILAPGQRPESNLMLSLGAILLVGGLARSLGFSPLLANLTMGFVVINRLRHADDLFHQLDLIEETVFCLFFTLAAAHFDLKVLATSAALGGIILIGRFIGKFGGAYIGGKAAHAPAPVTRFLGITLLPQGGVSLGLIFLAQPIVPPVVFEITLNAMLVSVILNEIISPPLLKWVLCRVGESNTAGGSRWK